MIDYNLRKECMEKGTMRLGIALSDAMNAKGVSVERLASEVGMLPVVLQRVLRGEDSVSVGMFDMLLSVLDCHLDIVDAEGNVVLPEVEEEDF